MKGNKLDSVLINRFVKINIKYNLYFIPLKNKRRYRRRRDRLYLIKNAGNSYLDRMTSLFQDELKSSAPLYND